MHGPTFETFADEFGETIDFSQVSEGFDRDRLEYLLSYLTPGRRERFAYVLSQRTRRITLVLENLYLSRNFSAALRSCDCFGIQDAHLVDPKKQIYVSNDVARGAEKWLTIHDHLGPGAGASCMQSLKSSGFQILTTSPHGETTPVHEVSLEQPLAIVFGTEKYGVSDELASLADGHVHIPMVGLTESLNVSVAAAICLNNLATRLRQSSISWQLTDNEKADLLLLWARRSIRHVEQIESRYDADRAGTGD